MPSFPARYNNQSAIANYEAPPVDEIRRRRTMMQNIEVPSFMRQRRSSQSAKSRRASFKRSDQPAMKRRTSSKVTPMMLDRAERRRSSSTKQLQPPPQRKSTRQSFRSSKSGTFAPMVVTDRSDKSNAKITAERVNRRTNMEATDTAKKTSPYKIFIPGITGKARCLQENEDTDEEMYDDDTTTDDANSSLPRNGFFIPEIDGTPLGLKDRKKLLCHFRSSAC